MPEETHPRQMKGTTYTHFFPTRLNRRTLCRQLPPRPFPSLSSIDDRGGFYPAPLKKERTLICYSFILFVWIEHLAYFFFGRNCCSLDN